MIHRTVSSVVRCLTLVIGLSTLTAFGESTVDNIPTADAVSQALVTFTQAEKPATCDTAASAGITELDQLSCRAGAPVSEDGRVASAFAELEGDTPQACVVYYGLCTGYSGCSTLYAGGYRYTVCGSYIRPWMRFCNGRLNSWGYIRC